TRSTLPAGYPTDTTTNPNTYVAKLSANGSAPVIGPGIILKVMAGDQFSVRVSSWYRLNGSAPGAPISPATDILSHLISGMAGLPTAENPGLSALQANSSALSADVLNFLQDTGTAINSSRPHAFVNWILLDNQFNYVAASSGFSQVGNDQELHVTTLTNVPITSNGYLYIYTSNEDPIVNVYFDNLQVTHTRGPLLEEDHYYPGGLTMAGISDKALKSNYAENKYRYNGKELQHQEFSDGSGLEEYDYGARFQDPQLGVWHSIDPKANDFATMSPYAQMNDNPIRYKDPTGKSADDWVKKKNTGQYEWKNNVTSAASTPKGYTYVGHDDNSIIKDLGWNSNMAPQSKTTIGYVAADDENEGPVTYSASDIIKVKAETSITVNAVVDTKYDLGKGDISKTFIGVSIGITNISKTTSGMDITAPATASLNFNGQQYTKALGDLPSNEAHVSATGSQVTAGNIMIPAAQINSGAKFPTVTVSGYWTHQTEGGSQTPVVNHPLYPTVKTFNFTFGQ
ncbi:MAG TPA: RHS repeat-associated core domain-containing protein, partial [Puia sp.]|nr:RHS repeat-associated core domain-containing protein [Puia sp.]